jgi:hypothetical protein
MFALIGDPSHHATLRRIVQWFPFGNEMNVFADHQCARQWLSLYA